MFEQLSRIDPMELLGIVFMIVVGIGAVIVALGAIFVLIVGLIVGWWWMIPVIGACVGGWIGFMFGLGLVAIILAIVAAIKGDK